MELKELKDHLISLDRYEEEVISTILHHVKTNEKIDYLQLRMNGITAVISNGLTEEQLKKQIPNWNADWLDIKKSNEK